MKIDIARCKDGMMNIVVEGVCNSPQRKELIEEAIASIQKDGANCFKGEYFGIKNYAGFGDQREDHSYGMCPRHGTIVFSIGRQSKCETVMGANEIYYLECERDFFSMLDVKRNGYDTYKKELNLGQVIQKMEDAGFIIEECEAHIKKQEVETH